MIVRAITTIALAVAIGACGSSVETSAPNPTISGAVTTSDVTSLPPRPEITTTTIATGDEETDRPAAPSSIHPTVGFTTTHSLAPLSDTVADHRDQRLLAVTQGGTIHDLGHDDLLTVLDITHLTRQNGEQGLLGAVLSHNGEMMYLNFTSTEEQQSGDTIIAAIPRAPDGSFPSDDLITIMTIAQPYGNHNGGDLEILGDGSLLIAVGDGGSGGDPERHSHVLDDPLGKLLRIQPLPDGGYRIPIDNPYVDGALGEVWSSGLRNPWRIDVDPLTTDLWIADVGQNEHEEINRVTADTNLVGGRGVDFGWSSFEGYARFNDDVSPDERSILAEPVYTYPHVDGACSVTGGVVYRGDLIEDLWGWYVFGDFCTGVISAYNYVSQSTVELGVVAMPTSIERDHRGEIVVATATGDIVSVVRP
ncbi:MAG: PQQ-dependent sugar dehydrogenase [Actinomycetota bacterium]|nr:PQQ-dependent sugar dehydrogenase [Actinomycetota bacterium]MEC8465469.1 PQQ-dependent sugar dehydrogenase [Actinomycetota bacterium]MEC8501946.1 PQQ-dependent sugar dehydrogenase [Actinomycetota bacterium]MEC8520701.1 PQQ-dependent sugar dehydrogenase [Actinomycetota bacterium]MEC9181267.1 PQQ-dependent sugar dehydrogenase [Actinomycetota bacterium]